MFKTTYKIDFFIKPTLKATSLSKTHQYTERQGTQKTE